VKKHPNPLWLPFIAKVLAYFLLLFPLAVYLAYHLAYWNKSYPGVMVGELRLGNRRRDQIEQELSSYFDTYQEPLLEIVSGDNRLYLDLSTYGFAYRPSETAQRVLSVGRSRNLVRGFATKIRSWRQGVVVDPVVGYRPGGLERMSLDISLKAAGAEQIPKLSLVDGQVVFQMPLSGEIVDRQLFERQVSELLEDFSFTLKTLPTLDIPDYSASDLAQYQIQVQALVDQPPQLRFDQQTYTPSPDEVLGFVDLHFFVDSDSLHTSISLTPDLFAINSYVAQLAEIIDREPQTETFKMEDGRVTTFRPSRVGRRLDRAALVSQLYSYVESKTGSVIDLEVALLEPEPPREVNPWGLKELVGWGESNFKGSSAGRVANIDLGSSRLDGILIPPGEEFSFNSGVGEITRETGYATSYVIARGRTVLGVGGGICQVSTTLFRAAINAGLPITERLAHDYRVHYYEPPVGFDATVYQPSVDFRFVNDTGEYLLIKREFDRESSSLRFDLYGTKDGRQVEVSEPTIYYQTPPPSPLYQDDPNLDEGVIRQIDWSAWGAKVSFTRRVTRGEEILQDDTFVSVYRPWQAVYLRGTKKANL